MQERSADKEYEKVSEGSGKGGQAGGGCISQLHATDFPYALRVHPLRRRIQKVGSSQCRPNRLDHEAHRQMPGQGNISLYQLEGHPGLEAQANEVVDEGCQERRITKIGIVLALYSPAIHQQSITVREEEVRYENIRSGHQLQPSHCLFLSEWVRQVYARAL